MGFTSKYEGTDRIELGDGYWVEVKKCLTWAESNDAEKAGLNFNMSAEANGTGNQQPRTRTNVIIDPEAKAFEQVLASVVDWSLTDRDGTKLALDFDRELEKTAHKANRPNWMSPRRQSLLKLPQHLHMLDGEHRPAGHPMAGHPYRKGRQQAKQQQTQPGQLPQRQPTRQGRALAATGAAHRA